MSACKACDAGLPLVWCVQSRKDDASPWASDVFV
jgi:hypothetical protein